MEEIRIYETRINLPIEVREQMIKLLNQHLADTFDVYSQTKQAHWNVAGRDFFQFHELFDRLAGEVLGYVDLIAERATTLGGTALGTIRMSSVSSRLPEYPVDVWDGLSSVEALATRYGILSAVTRKAIDTANQAGDLDTTDLFTEVSRGIDKSLWLLEAHSRSAGTAAKAG